jgi:hypothetical protein
MPGTLKTVSNLMAQHRQTKFLCGIDYAGIAFAGQHSAGYNFVIVLDLGTT